MIAMHAKGGVHKSVRENSKDTAGTYFQNLFFTIAHL